MCTCNGKDDRDSISTSPRALKLVGSYRNPYLLVINESHIFYMHMGLMEATFLIAERCFYAHSQYERPWYSFVPPPRLLTINVM